MALSFPLGIGQFAGLFPISSVKWKLKRNNEVSGLGSGAVIINEIGAPMWMAEVELGRMTHARASRAAALIEALEDPGATFHLYNPSKQYPTNDPDGATYGSSNPTVHSVASGKLFRIANLPSGYTLRLGDMFTVTYGSDPVRRALFRMVEDATADGSGVTGQFEVRPFIRSGIAASNSVTFARPYAKMVIIPGSFDPGTAGPTTTSGMSFQAIETI